MFEELINDIIAGRCILFIGPMIASSMEDGKWLSLIEKYCAGLSVELHRRNVAFDATATQNPYYLAGKFLDGTEVRSKFERDLASQLYANRPEMYEKLARLPFNTIVNLGCDKMLNDELIDKGYEFSFRYYNYRGGESSHLKTDDNIQLVYNLMGSLDDRSSRVLTERDQIEFIRRITSTPKLPDDLLSRIRQGSEEQKSYVFLGFNFGDWPFRLLLDTLEVPKAPTSIGFNSEQCNIAVMTRDFYEDRFGISFTDVSPIQFIDDLTARYDQQVYHHQYGLVSFNKESEEFATMLNENIEASGLGRRIMFWDRSKMNADDQVAETTALHLQRDSVYIPFLSKRALIDPAFRAEMTTMRGRPEVIIIPIAVHMSLWRETFPWLEKRAAVILPGPDSFLVNSTGQAGNEEYVRMVKIINSKTR
jgi:hypothetical protein